jgi:hypothetical protein
LGEYINAQTYQGPLKWIIVDDCDPETRIPGVRAGIDVKVIRPGWRWQSGMNTQAECMRIGLLDVPEDAVLFVLEDDDIYLTDYMMTALRMLEQAELVGEIDSRYYNIATVRWNILKGRFHSSMAATACRGEALRLLREVCDDKICKMLDVKLWKKFTGSKRLMLSENVIGVKGLPGRPGIGVGHRASFGKADVNDIFALWAGPYADNYEIFREAV